MKYLGIPFALLALCGTAHAADRFLVRVYLGPGQQPTDVAAIGADVVLLFNDGCLARAEAGVLSRLAATFTTERLDDDPDVKCYVYVADAEGVEYGQLSSYGNVLAKDGSGVLLSTTEEGISGLNRLPVELARVPMRPMVLSPPGLTRPCSVPDSLIWTLVNRVSQDTLESNLRRLIGFYTRYSTTDSCRQAVNWVRGKFIEYGCDSTALHTFNSSYAPNVMGVRAGEVHPQRIYVICGHADNTSEYAPPNLSPGSDDNASGTSLLVELARVFSDMAFACTVWFVGFTGEEQGLVGSDSFVHLCRQRGDSIALAINFDMVSYARDDSATIVYTSSFPQTESLAHFFLAQADTFTQLKAKDTLLNTGNSDHYSFWRYGYLAIRGRYHDRTPKYHTTGDTIGPFHYANCGTNNLPLFTEMTRATVATLAKLAGAHRSVGLRDRGSPTPRYLLAATPNPFTIMTTIQVPGTLRTLPRAAVLRVYDTAGRPVRAQLSARDVHLSLDMGSLPPGVYFCLDLTGLCPPLLLRKVGS